jgi:hypothetical protein
MEHLALYVRREHTKARMAARRHIVQHVRLERIMHQPVKAVAEPALISPQIRVIRAAQLRTIANGCATMDIIYPAAAVLPAETDIIAIITTDIPAGMSTLIRIYRM